MSDRQQAAPSRAIRAAAGAAITLLLAACGGGGGGSSSAGTAAPRVVAGFTPGVFQPESSFKNQCATPRTGRSTVTGDPFPDMKGTATSENNWLRSWTNDLYLWYSEVPDLNPGGYATLDYFDLLKTSQTTTSGAMKDRFHFTMSTAEWEAFSQSGTVAGYGAQFFFVQSTPPRKVVVAYTEPASPAAVAGVQRGDEILSIDGADSVNGSGSAVIATLNAGLSPATIGENHVFVLRNPAGASRSVTLTSANVTSTPVQNVRAIATPAGNVGYLLFNDHIATAEAQLVTAINSLKAQNVVDLVLDIRYNGGGYLDIASELAYMIAGSTRTDGQTFERIAFNDKHTATNPVTGQPLSATAFQKRALGFSAPNGTALPTLDLQKVYVLTSSDTCSASEAIINGLRGVDVQVIQIGKTTCGKPYGFYPEDNCGTTYFSVQFKGVNAKSFGDYADGFSPQNTQANKGTLVDGCSVADDFTHGLGDEAEKMLAAALDHRMSGSCPTPAAQLGFTKPDGTIEDSPGHLLRPEWRKNRLMRVSD